MENANEKLQTALARVNKDRERDGIGTLGEKTLHLALKYYYEENELFHEQKIGRYFADIATPSRIIEIQTRSFENLKKKLEVFLKISPVTVVFPIPYVKSLVWIDEETGEMQAPHKSPRKGKVYQALGEITKIAEFIEHPAFSFKVILLDMLEYRLLNGWSKDKKRGSRRFERVPTTVAYEYCFNEISDYQALVPSELPARFFSKDFKKAAGISMRETSFALLMLTKLNILLRVGKAGNAFIYERNYNLLDAL